MKISKFIKNFLLTLVILYNFFIPISVLAKSLEEVKQNAVKSDIYNPQTNELGNIATINDYNYSNNETYEAGDVEVKKVVKNKYLIKIFVD